jgi:hypothetical protein
MGYRVESYKLWIFTFSAVLAGIAGALYVPQVGIINPSEFQPINSIEVVIWVAVGGRGVLYGAVAGAVIVNYAKTFFTAALPEFWLYALGLLFVVVTLFLPRGVVGLLDRFGRKPPAAPQAPVVEAPGGGRMNAAQVVKQGWQKVFGAGTGSDRPDAGRRVSRHHPVRRRHHRELRRLSRAEQSHAVHRRRRASLHHRTERRRQDDDDGRDHRARRVPTQVRRGFGTTTDLLTLTNPEIAEAGIGRKFQKPTVFEATQRSCRNPGARRPRETSRSGTRCSKPIAPAQLARIDEVLVTVGLKITATFAPGSCRTGQKQWLEIGMLLMQDPRLLLVDEPVAGMTPQEVERTAELLQSLGGQTFGRRGWSTTWSSCARSHGR